MNRLWLTTFCVLSMPCAMPAQSVPANPAKSASQKQSAIDYSKEPFVVEQYSTTVRFENDGTSKREVAARVRVQTDTGAQQLRDIVFDFDSASERVDVRSVRVQKPDGI